MKEIEAKEFLDMLNSGNIKTGAHIFGLVKKSEKPSELLFAFKWAKENWISIPETMIDHVHIIGEFTVEEEKYTKVKIRLKEPANAEAKILHSLLAGLSWKLKKMW